MPIILETGHWGFWAAVIVIILVVMYFVWGGKRGMEVVGLRPIYTPTYDDHPVSVSPKWDTDVHDAPSPHFFDDIDGTLPSISPRFNPNPALPTVIPHKPRLTIIREEPTLPVIQFPATVQSPSAQPAKKYRSIGEELTCTAMEALLGRSVQNSVRPNHLRNPKTGRNLEYDCWDPVNRWAVEYDGVQHARFTPRFHNSPDDFASQQERDKLKVELSTKHGIPLIRVPHTVDVCDPDQYDPSGYRYNPRITRAQRYERIYAYLREQFTHLQQTCTAGVHNIT